MKDEKYPRATVEIIDGKKVLNDPDALAIIVAINKANCKNTFDLQIDRVENFKNRLYERELSPADNVIVLVNADDVHGKDIAEALMPEFNWQEIRDRGEIPFARGLAKRQGIEEILKIFDPEASEKLKNTEGVAVVVVDHQTAEIFSV